MFMNRFFLAFCLCLCAPFLLGAQVWPKDGASVRYRLIGFSAPPAADVTSYRIEVAQGTFYNEDSFKSNITISKENNVPRAIIEVPQFGLPYSWRVVYSKKNKRAGKSELYHFMVERVDVNTSQAQLRIIKHADKYKDASVFLDETHALYDMEGHPFWYLPDLATLGSVRAPVRDLKLTPQGQNRSCSPIRRAE